MILNKSITRIRLTTCLIILTNISSLLAINSPDENYKSIIKKAIKSTFEQGALTYSAEYRSLNPSGDTTSLSSKTTIENNSHSLSFTSIFKDSLKVIYFNEVVLWINMNRKSYKAFQVKPDEVSYQVSVLYPPLLEKGFLNGYVNNKVKIDKLQDNRDFYLFKITVVDPDEVDDLAIVLKISKFTNTVIEYILSASVGGMPIWEGWKLLYFKKDIDSSQREIIKNDYTETIKNFTKTENKSARINLDSLKVQLARLEKALPFLDLISLNNDTIKLSSLKSKYYLVDFWYRSCYPCIKSVPVIKALHSKYDNTFLHIVSINNVDKVDSIIQNFIDHNMIDYDVFVGSVQNGKQFIGVNTWPHFIIYDSDFNVLHSFDGYVDNLQEKIESYLVK
jgi:hypothetical protein